LYVVALDFYANALGTREAVRVTDPDGTRIGHAHVVADAKAGGFQFYLGDSCAISEMNLAARSKEAAAAKMKSPAGAYVLVPDCDLACKRFVDAGGEYTCEPKNEFYGFRVGKVMCPYGIGWTFAHALAGN
jgi:PhnB protein